MRAVRPGWAARSARAVAVALLLVVVAVGCGGGGGGGGDQSYVEPKGKATESLAIEAGNFYFDPKEPTAPAGIAEIELVGVGGIHTLVFDDEYSGFQLEVTGDETDAKKIKLTPGSFGFYCDVPGHRQQGMVGTLTVK